MLRLTEREYETVYICAFTWFTLLIFVAIRWYLDQDDGILESFPLAMN